MNVEHGHDLDLIAAYASGGLADPAEAEALVASCPTCAEAYRDHVVLLEAIAGEDPPTLADLERRRLRAAVWAEITPVSRPSRATLWGYRLASAAAVVVVVVGVASIVGRMGDEPATTFAAERVEFSPTAETTEAAGSADDADMVAAEAPDDTGEELEEAIPYAGEPALDAAVEDFRRQAVDEPETLRNLDEVACADDDPDQPEGALGADERVVDGEEVVLVAFGEPELVDRVIVYRAENCEVIFDDG